METILNFLSNLGDAYEFFLGEEFWAVRGARNESIAYGCILAWLIVFIFPSKSPFIVYSIITLFGVIAGWWFLYAIRSGVGFIYWLTEIEMKTSPDCSKKVIRFPLFYSTPKSALLEPHLLINRKGIAGVINEEELNIIIEYSAIVQKKLSLYFKNFKWKSIFTWVAIGIIFQLFYSHLFLSLPDNKFEAFVVVACLITTLGFITCRYFGWQLNQLFDKEVTQKQQERHERWQKSRISLIGWIGWFIAVWLIWITSLPWWPVVNIAVISFMCICRAIYIIIVLRINHERKIDKNAPSTQ